MEDEITPVLRKKNKDKSSRNSLSAESLGTVQEEDPSAPRKTIPRILSRVNAASLLRLPGSGKDPSVSSASQSSLNLAASAAATTTGSAQLSATSGSTLSSLSPRPQGSLRTTKSCIDVSTRNSYLPVDGVGKSASKSTSQLDTVGVMKIKNGRNVPSRRLEKPLLSKSSPDMSPSRSSLQYDDFDDGVIQSLSSRSKNKKFHRIFEAVDEGEKVLNDFACAYVADILLQGHLYVTETYFGFYSKVFGHVTKILIPVENVIEIKKVRTARLIPNAVKIVTESGNAEKKYTFSSLLSRENTHKMLCKVWRKYTVLDFHRQIDSECEDTSPELLPETPSEKPSPASSDTESNVDDKVSQDSVQALTSPSPDDEVDGPRSVVEDVKQNNVMLQACIDIMGIVFPVKRVSGRLKKAVISLSGLPRTTLFLFICTVLLLFLYLSAAFLIYRLNTLHYRYGIQTHTTTNEESSSSSSSSSGGENYKDIYQWNHQLHQASVSHLRESLAVQIQQLTEVRKSLQALGMLASDPGSTLPEAPTGFSPDRTNTLPDTPQPTFAT